MVPVINREVRRVVMFNFPCVDQYEAKLYLATLDSERVVIDQDLGAGTLRLASLR